MQLTQERVFSNIQMSNFLAPKCVWYPRQLPNYITHFDFSNVYLNYAIFTFGTDMINELERDYVWDERSERFFWTARRWRIE